jgi:hypothetical protein
MVTRPARPLLLPVLLIACGGDAEPDPTVARDASSPPSLEAQLPPMDPTRALIRASIDLRGARPSLAELDRIDTDPDAYDELVAAFMADPRFEARMVDFWAEVFLTRTDRFAFQASDFGRADEPAFARSVGEEPIRMAARLAAEGAPWTDLVTADWTMANRVLTDIWPVEAIGDPDPSGWFPAVYTDGRPAAGVLASNGMWWRYTSTDSNANRKRANQISRVLLCNDYLLRPIDFDRDVNLLDADAVQDAISTDPGCVNCHNSLDPIAAYLFGFWAYNQESWIESTTYHPARERLYDDYLGVAPAWYGAPGSGLSDLGHQIAGDPRFPDCAVERVYTGLLRRDADLADIDALTRHREAFLAGDLSLQSLLASVVTDPRYLSADSAHPALDPTGAVPTKMATADLLATQIEDLTGFTWSYFDYDMMRTDLVGLRTLAGGADGQATTRSARAPNATLLLVQERLAEAGASAVLASDAALPAAERRLFTELDFSETPDGPGRDAMVAQVQVLHRRIFGTWVEPDGDAVTANLTLWSDLYAATGDRAQAWVGVLSALLRDPDFLLY